MRTALTVLLSGLLLTAAPWCEAVKVYKWTDGQGHVIYSDSPRPGAQEIDVPTEPEGIVPVPPEQMPSSPPAAPGEGYGALIVASPANDQVVQALGRRLNVSLAVEPPLRVDRGDAIRLTLDGVGLATRYTGSTIVIPDVDRGAHSLQAEVVDSKDNVLIASTPVSFTVQEPSSQAPAGPDVYPPVYPPQPYPPTYTPVYPPQPYPPQGRPKPTPTPTPR